MGSAFGACQNLLEQACLEDRSVSMEGVQQRGLHLRLRVDASPIRPSMGTHMHNFKLTDEFLVEAIELLPGFEPLGWRHEREVRGQGLWPGGLRCSAPMRYVRARVCGQWVLLAVAVAHDHRSMDRVLLDIEDAKDAAVYAHSFNAHLMRNGVGADDLDPRASVDHEAPQLRICVPIGCRVLSSALPQFAHPGSVVLLIPFPALQVHKFMFDGLEDFTELPQAFFHYVVWMSGGRELLFDIQGVEDENGSFVLVDPVVVRTPKAGFSDFVAGQASPAGGGPSQEIFDAMHPRCGQLCKSFDPQRRGAKARKMCGLDVPGCGLAGK